jgi:tRNA(Ile)-lysidine synthase TilS/MesJ
VTTAGHRRGAFERALAFSRGRRLFRPGERVLVGSGAGVASLGAVGFIALAARTLGLAEIAVAAVDLGHPDDAEVVADVGRVARQLGVTFYALSAEGAAGPTPALLALARRERYARVVLGHTRDDAVARVFAGLVSGRGLEGVRPLVARLANGVVRPLLDLREAEALELARTAGIEPAMLPPEPGTARPPVETRLRASVLPRLRVEAPGSDDALLALGREISQLRALVYGEAGRVATNASSGASGLELPLVGTSTTFARAVARAALTRLDVPSTVVRAAAEPLARLLRGRPDGAGHALGEVVLGPGVVASYLPARRVVALRVARVRRVREPGASG